MPNSSKKSDIPELKTPTRAAANNSSSSTNTTPNSSYRRLPRKRRRIEKDNGHNRGHSLDSKLDDCNIEDAKEIDRRLRRVARENSISSEDMHKVVRSVVRNEHVLALVTLKAEDEIAREKREAEAQEEQQQRGAIIITETPSVAKLTRAKARELNRTPGINLPPLNDKSCNNEIEALIRADLHSDEEDEEYTFKEDDFHSDDDHNTNASDFDSNPCTPQTPLTANEESPIKYSSDGCFKIPVDKNPSEDPRIATRTRSKLCLQQTTIEDLQSEFVPPDVEEHNDVLEYDMTANDADWMQFLKDFSRPLNNNFLGDDDDPINDPEYVGGEMVPVDAEELRDVNISKKELTDLVSELFAGLLKEGVSLDSIELETPQKFLINQESIPAPELPPNPIDQVTRQIDFNVQPSHVTVEPVNTDTELADISVKTHVGSDSFHPTVMSTPSSIPNFVAVPLADTFINGSHQESPCTIVNISAEIIGHQPPELIAVPLPGQPNCFQLAKVVNTTPPIPAADNTYAHTQSYSQLQENIPTVPSKPTESYDTNFSCKYLSVRKLLSSEYEDYFENLRYVKPQPSPMQTPVNGFTQAQHDMLQQQLRIHTQMLTQSFVQTYSHPLLYKLAHKPKEMILELHNRAVSDASFSCWNLNGAVELINKWEHDLSSDEYDEENKEMMKFLNKEISLTEKNTRQVPRLPPRIMDLMLDNPVFMYPQYLPRMAFQPKTPQCTIFAPSESQLIAMGLEKHLNAIRNMRKPLRKGADPVRSACKRMVKDVIHGKEFRRIIFKIKELCDMEQYNPVKYYFDHGRAPPVNQYLYGFEASLVRLPRDQFYALPNAWKYYIEKNWNNDKRASRSAKPNSVQVSVAASTSYLDFVREAVGEDLLLPDYLGDPVTPHASVTDHYKAQFSQINVKPSPISDKPKSRTKKPRKLRHQTISQQSSSLTINVNYVFGGELGNNKNATGVSVPFKPDNYENVVANINRTLVASSDCSVLEPPPPVPPLPANAAPAVNFSFDELAQTVNLTDLNKSAEQTTQPNNVSGKKVRYSIFKHHFITQPRRRNGLASSTPTTLLTRRRYHVSRQRLRYKLQKRCLILFSSYRSYLRQQRNLYTHAQSVQFYYRRCLALELYTHLLVDLRMFCQSKNQVQPGTTGSPQQQKRLRSEDAARRANRQEEMLRHMLQPDIPEERNRKDATFAFNFYEKVEEALLSANRLEDCQKFNHLLQTFDPKQDKVSELYLNVEKLLLPDYPELAEVFLNFLLPAEAAELGKFFEYFMITNASNFINKLNIYFCKQPAQIRKIYACLSELAELPSVSMKKVESRILPLLKGNQFLSDWLVQQFPQAKPPQRLLPSTETVNLHEVLHNTSGEFTETLHELPDDPPAQGKPPGCQLRYLNGRIFYGSKIMLPAKLSFRAASIYNEQYPDALSDHLTCAHAVRAQGEKLINAAVAVDSDDATDRSEEDEASRALVIDTTGDEENSSSSIDMCDQLTLRGHAIRLNGNYYNSFNHSSTSTPMSSSHHAHHPNAKKTAINFGETSPRRQTSQNASLLSGVSPLPALGSNTSPQLDKRKSPSKKVRSPSAQTQGRPRYNVQPMVVIHEPTVRTPAVTSPVIESAKRLRTLIDQVSNTTEELDNKAGISIIAQAKQSKNLSNVTPPKVELDSHEDREILSTDCADANQPNSIRVVKMDVGNSSDECRVASASSTPRHVIISQFDSDEDCKLDVVATLANCADDTETVAQTAVTPSTSTPAPQSPNSSSAWTREEDKVILIEMKLGARDREHLIRRMGAKLRHRNKIELRARHQFLMDFLSKLQGK